ncbi:50S ribosomal protein L1 [Patescibacteria group bacterium]|nr:50S ribosomal protein L1 [Patescibacteria group bacterium]MBU1703314.1 50S ribosomal protein L1 [Patescibacteria group bacterium]MBU1954387.1 50S ribosomal protein L1 [Patescibacteria group bacterium]
MAKHGKKYRKAVELLAEKSDFTLDEAVKLLKETSTTKFDASCEIHMRLGIDTTQADQLVRSTISLPHGTGKKVRVIAIVPDDKVKESLDAGAIKAGHEELIDEIAKGFLDFDVVVATPDVMKNLGKVAKTLGTKGLMPNPKAGTVSPTPGKTIKEIAGGRVEYRTDKQGQIHQIFGKVSFSEDQLKENLTTFVKAVTDAKPAAVKGVFVKNLCVATSMGPGIKLDVPSVMAEIK